MPYSLTFNSIYLGTYGLIINEKDIPNPQSNSAIQLQTKAYPFKSYLPPIDITLTVSIIGNTHELVKSYKDSIDAALYSLVDAPLKLDDFSDRYWMARKTDFSGKFNGPTLWQGTLVFVASDPLAYDRNQVSTNYSINADPKSLTITPGGTGQIKPVWTLTAAAILTGVTIILTNATTGESISWTGTLAIADVLTIDSSACIVYKNGVASMTGVACPPFWPTLSPGANTVTVTGFGTAGSMNLAYRNRYL